MWFGCLEHVRKDIGPKTWPLLMTESLFSLAANTVPPHHSTDILYLSRTIPLLTAAYIPPIPQT